MTTTTLDRPVFDPLHFSVTDVTARHTLEVDEIDGHRPAGEVAASMASLLELPEGTPYSLRDDAKARLLHDDEAVGSQVTPGARLVLLPKAHLA